ncbi:hypothetical protein [Aliikangiella coralliicola]|uniref:hypothetical protein n=1 Tax=Aliikangiella coralliicola TaxID=2592383 RepID=UPI00143DBD89|nr:hypothetical protein [Aliikangiella coralliicola]
MDKLQENEQEVLAAVRRFARSISGSIEVDKPADLVVLSRDIRALTPAQIKQTTI